MLKEVKLNKELFYYMQQNNDLNFEPQDVNIVNPKQARKAVIATGIGNARSGLTSDYTRI